MTKGVSVTHGYGGARQGCVCEVCANAKAEYERARRRAAGAPPKNIKQFYVEPKYLVDEGPACGHPDVDPEWFFMVQPNIDLDVPDLVLTVQMTNRLRTANAKAVCAGCPIQAECLRDNLTAEYGIFGGKTAPERHKIVIERGGTWPADELYLDDAAVDRAIHGEKPPVTRFEWAEARRRLLRMGYTSEEILDILPQERGLRSRGKVDDTLVA